MVLIDESQRVANRHRLEHDLTWKAMHQALGGAHAQPDRRITREIHRALVQHAVLSLLDSAVDSFEPLRIEASRGEKLAAVSVRAFDLFEQRLHHHDG